jgi:hypothetical protein
MLQFQVSPPKKAQRNLDFTDEIENRSCPPPSYLVLGPHAKVPKIHFEEIKLGKSKKAVLIIRNPADTYVNLKFVKKPCNDFTFSYDLDAIITIPATEQTSIEITWTPTKEGHFFETCQLINSFNGIKLSVHLLGKCTAPHPMFKSRGLTKGKRSVLCPPQFLNTNSRLPSLPSNAQTTEFKQSAPIPIAPKKSWAVPDIDILKTPPRSSALESVENATFPFTPEHPSAQRRETFIVEKEDTEIEKNSIAEDRRATFVVDREEECLVTGTITMIDDEVDEDTKMRNDIDEALAELQNLENMVCAFVNSFA